MMSENERENEKRETLADILAEMFDFSDKRIEEGRDHAMTSESVGLIVHQLAKRFEAAWKREREAVEADALAVGGIVEASRHKPGNAAAMREALVAVQKKIEYLCGSFNVPNSLVAGRMEINGIINAALSAPPRQCDVGTAEEQVARHHLFCNAMMKKNNHCCGPCPCYKFVNGEAQSCTLLWAQMPYEAEEGGAK